MASGIYLITCKENNRKYVGSAKNISNRWRDHRSFLARAAHHSRYLQRAWTKYGADAFEWTVIEVVDDPTQLLAREQFWIDTLHPEFNGSPYANRPTNTGHKMSLVSRQKASESNKRHWASLTDEQRKARGAKAQHSHSGETKQILSERTKQAYKAGKLSRVRPSPAGATRQKISATLLQRSAEKQPARDKARSEWELGREAREQLRREKVSRANKGKPKSAATKAKLRAAATEQMANPEMRAKHRAAVQEAMQRPEVKAKHRKGIENRPPMSAEHRANIGAAHKGMKRPAETGAKIAASKRGKKRSPETIEKLKAAQQARWARVRAEKERNE
jgi:group I intron endonuclease